MTCVGQGHTITIPQLTVQLHFRDFQEEAKKIRKPKVEVREPSEEEEVVVTVEKPPPGEPTYTTWKRARIFPMIFKKVRGLADRRGLADLEGEEWPRRLEEADKDYLKLTLDQDEATESTVESEEESSSDYTEYSEEESEFSESETTEEESESETPSEEEESSTPESSEESESTESEGEKAQKNIFLARRRPVVEEVKAVKGRKEEPPELLEEEPRVEEEEAGEESELGPEEEPAGPEVPEEEGSAESASVEAGVDSEEESELGSSVSSSSESQSGGPWGFQVPKQATSKRALWEQPPGADSEGDNTAL